jgi:CheY-like chemotaxis protein
MTPDDIRFPILVADDNPTDVFFLRRRLAAAGCTAPVHHFDDGMEAMNWLERYIDAPAGDPVRPWLLFVDLKMPRMDGFELLAWLKSRRLTEQMTVSVLSTSDEPVDVERAARLGAHRFLVKYPSPADLAELVRLALDRATGASYAGP